jgi:hypothetical protein
MQRIRISSSGCWMLGGVPLLIALLASLAGIYWLIWWIVRWHKKLATVEFPTSFNDVIRGLMAGIACATLWLTVDFAIRWQQNDPFWDRQAWECRLVMALILLLNGVTTGTAVFKIRRFKRRSLKSAL